MANRVTIPVKGGLYKSVRVNTQQSAGTTISGFDNQIVSLDQLRAALGLNNKASVTPPSGGGIGSASLIVAPGLVGGGPLLGAVPLRINKAQAAAMFMGGGDDDGGTSGAPGKRGKNGAIGANGAAGTPGGPRGYPIALVTEPEEAMAIPVRGRRGFQGIQGIQGISGKPKIWLPENDYEEPMFVGRAKASTGAVVAPTTLAAAILSDSPFAFWKCDDTSTSLADSSGNGFNLTSVTGTPTYQSGLLIPTLPSTTFVNLSGYANTAAANGFFLASALGRTLPLTSFTVELIISQFASSVICRYISWAVSGTANIFSLYNNGGPLSCAINNANIPLLPSGLISALGIPTHIVITCSTVGTTSTLTTYLNGIRVAVSVTATASTASGGAPIFGLGDAGTYSGTTAGVTMGYVALFPTVLSVARIGAHAAAAGMLGL